jgi:hypothetical protein
MIKNLFLIYIFFFSVSLFNTSDLNLFLEDEIYFFYMPISLHFFYFVSPIVLFFLHYFYLNEVWFKKPMYLRDLPPFYLYGDLIEKIVLFLEIITPLLLFFIVQIKLARLQELAFTYFHYFLFLLDFILVFMSLSNFCSKALSSIYEIARDKIKYFHKINEQYFIQTTKFLLFLLLLLIPLFCATYNFYLLNSILLSNENLPVESYKLNLFLSTENTGYSLLFPRLNLEGLDLSVGKNKFSSGRNFKYANFQNSTLRISSLNKANTEFANFTGVRWIGE